MSVGSVCPKCGFTNQAGTAFCSNCGTAMTAAASPYAGPTYGAPPMPPYGYALTGWDTERTKQIDRTKTGLLLLVVGGLIGWIPILGLLGGLLLLIGAILVILGRKAFGATHARNVILAIGLFFLGLITVAVASVPLAFAVAAARASQDPSEFADSIASAFNILLLGAAVVSAISGIGSVLFTHALQQQTGKTLLWAGYGASLAIEIAIFAIISPLVPNAVSQAVSGATYDPAPLDALQAQVTTLGLLSVIPALLFAAASYLAWSRVSRGEIPPPTVPPGMATASQTGPAPPINLQ